MYDPYNPGYITISDSISDAIRRELFDKIQMRAIIEPCSFEPYTCYRVNLNDINTKETEKMEAKKCDRCGKLYEMPGEMECETSVVRFKFIRVADAENKSGTKIAKEQIRNIYIKKSSLCDNSSIVDLCPECRKSLKTWFESADKEGKKV